MPGEGEETLALCVSELWDVSFPSSPPDCRSKQVLKWGESVYGSGVKRAPCPLALRAGKVERQTHPQSWQFCPLLPRWPCLSPANLYVELVSALRSWPALGWLQWVSVLPVASWVCLMYLVVFSGWLEKTSIQGGQDGQVNGFICLRSGMEICVEVAASMYTLKWLEHLLWLISPRRIGVFF